MEIFNFVFSWGSFNDIILRRVKEGWLQPHLQFLIEFLKYNPCKELTDFNSEFKDFNHGEIGLLYAGCPDHLVYNNSSWEKFHQRYVATFSFEERCNKFDYFKNFYIPNLRVDINQIEQLIKNNKVHNSIIRIDPPEIAYEKIHVHFEDEKVECALNIDGTWKHSPKKNYKIKREAFMFLHDCGFLLPDEYYQ